MKRSDDLKDMVAQSEMSTAAKTNCMHYIDKLRPLENGAAGSVEALAAAMLAQAPIIIEMYERETATTADISKAIEEQAQRCALAGNGVADDLTGVITAAMGTGVPKRKRDAIISLVKVGGWPAVAVWFFVQFAPQIRAILAGCAV